MTFQAPDQKSQQFLELVNGEDNPIKPFYAKREPWLKIISYSNSLYARAMQAIVNYVPIGEYRLCFFLKEEFKYPCRSYPIELR